MSDLISIIIPAYNHAHFLPRAINSVKAQTYRNWEVIIVDNNSTDNTDEVLSLFVNQRIKTYKINNDGIIARSRNLGIERANGKYIAFLDSDDWWAPKKLEKSMAQLLLGADLVFHGLYMVENNKFFSFPFRRVTSRNLKKNVFDDLIKQGNGIPNSSVVTKTEILKKIGLLNESKDFIGWEDYDLWLRLAHENYKFVRLRGTLGYYWWGGNNMSSPHRTIKNCMSFCSTYIKDSKFEVPMWVTYNLGRSFFLLKDFELAKKNLKNIYFWKTPIMLWFKTRVMLTSLMLKQRRLK